MEIEKYSVCIFYFYYCQLLLILQTRQTLMLNCDEIWVLHKVHTWLMVNLCQMELRLNIFFPSVMFHVFILTFVPLLLLSFLSDPSIDDSGAVSPDQDDKQGREKTEKHKKKVNKATKPKYNEAKGQSIFG